jgi:hypothetical protein
MSLAYSDTVKQSRGADIYLVLGGNDASAQPAWYFIRVEAAKQRMFLKTINSGAAKLSQFGTILGSGYGKEPPYSVLERMRTIYGYTG